MIIEENVAVRVMVIDGETLGHATDDLEGNQGTEGEWHRGSRNPAIWGEFETFMFNTLQALCYTTQFLVAAGQSLTST